MFHIQKDFSSQTVTCDINNFYELMDSPLTIERCAEIRRLVETLPADASEAQRKAAEDRITLLKKGSGKTMPNLPCWCFHAWFKDNRRVTESAVPSGLVSLDIDHLQQPRQFFEPLLQKAIDMGLLFAFVTPSTQGLKLVFAVPSECHTIEEAQEKIANQLGINPYLDGQCFDLTRTAFAVPRSYIIYIDEQKLFAEQTLPEGFGTEEQYAQHQMQQTSTLTDPTTPELISMTNEASEHYYEGFCFSDILTTLSIKFSGSAVPPVGRRNTTLYQTAKMVNAMVDGNLDMLCRVMPQWGMNKTEWLNTLRSANSRTITQATRHEVEVLIHELRREKAVAEGRDTFALPPLPKALPPVFREFAHVTPLELQDAQMFNLLPILGMFGSMVKANYADPGDVEDWRTPSFITVIDAPSGSGKGIFTRTFRSLTDDQKLAERPLMEQLNIFNKTNKPADLPKGAIRLLPEKMSTTSLSIILGINHGQHALLFTPEIETLKSSNGSGGWNDLSTIFRKAIDNDPAGQLYRSAESYCTEQPIYLNLLIQAQDETMEAFFTRNNVNNGLVSRVFFVKLPDDLGCERKKMKKMSPFAQANVNRVIEHLKNVGVVTEEAQYDEDGMLVKPEVKERQIISLPRTRRALREFDQRHREHFLQNQENVAEDHFRRRAAMLGFHAGIVAYLCCGDKETDEVVDFALWVAEYTIQSQMLHFGHIVNESASKREKKYADRIIAINSLSQFNLYEALPKEFGIADINQLQQAQGQHLQNPYNKIKRWVTTHMVVEVASKGKTKRWRKCKKQE